MKQRLRDIFDADSSTTDYARVIFQEFGLSAEKHYDLLVVAPGWKPSKIMESFDVKVTCTREHSYISGYEVEGRGFLMAWIQVSPGASSLLDELGLCSVLDFDKVVFLGAVGSLVPQIPIGALCTPSFCISGNLANGYLLEDIRDYEPFGKVLPNDPEFVSHVLSLASEMGFKVEEAPVFCTDSILCEYAHMNFIRSFGVSLIEMETSSFYLMADLLQKPAIALLAVSDNSGTGESLLLRTPGQKKIYDDCRKKMIPQILIRLANER